MTDLGGTSTDVRVRSAVRRNLFDFDSLPYSRREVERIAALYPARTTRTYLDAQATEEHAKATGRETRVVHFAVHGSLDDRLPLSSGLALSMPEGFPEDGCDRLRWHLEWSQRRSTATRTGHTL